MHNKCIFKKSQDICCGTSHNGRQAPKVCAAKSEKHFQSSRKNSIQHFRRDHNAGDLVYPTPPPAPQIFAKPLSWISAKTTVTPRRNWKQWLCNFFFFLGGGGGSTRCVMVYVKENMAAFSRGCKPRTHHSPVFHFDWNGSYRCLSLCYRPFSVT